MLVLLSAPRGRVSAARLLAHRRERGAAEARVVIHLPGVAVAGEPGPREGADGAHWPEGAARQ